MEIEPKYLAVSMVITLIVSFALMFFVWASTLYTWLDLFLFIVITMAVFIGSFMMQYQMGVGGFPIDVLIWENRANNIFISKDRAKRMVSNEKGKFAYVLKRKKVKTKPIDFSYIYIGSKGQNHLGLYSSQSGEYQPVKINAETFAKLNIMPENARYWYSEQLRRNYERWSKKFGMEKYAPFMMLIAVGFIITFMLYIFLGQMQGVITQINGISVGQAEIMKQMTYLMQQIQPNIRLPEGIPPPSLPV